MHKHLQRVMYSRMINFLLRQNVSTLLSHSFLVFIHIFCSKWDAATDTTVLFVIMLDIYTKNPFFCDSHAPHHESCCCACSFFPPMMVPPVVIWISDVCWLTDTLIRTSLFWFETFKCKSLIYCCSFWILWLVLFLLRDLLYSCWSRFSMAIPYCFIC